VAAANQKVALIIAEIHRNLNRHIEDSSSRKLYMRGIILNGSREDRLDLEFIGNPLDDVLEKQVQPVSAYTSQQNRRVHLNGEHLK